MINLADSKQKKTFKRKSMCTSLQNCAFLLLLGFSANALTQNITVSPAAASPSTKSANSGGEIKRSTSVNVASKPAWHELTPQQQISLKPLATNWNTLEEAHKRKWIAIAANFSTLSPTEQTTLHNRMTEWASLSYSQRAQARLNFANSKQLTPSEKTASWQAYQALSPEEKQKLKSLPLPKLAGAAISPKPVPAQKLAIVPVTPPSPLQSSKVVPSHQAVNQITLLPSSKLPVEPAAKQSN